MRLLKTGPFISGRVSTLELHEVHGGYRGTRKERYAVLSHTWGSPQDEVQFSDLVTCCDTAIRRSKGHIIVNLDTQNSIKEKPGWAKLAFALEQADADGKEWLFADTACIDRSSSAELAEAINSMWTWLTESRICYAYLSDLTATDAQEVGSGKTFTLSSRWFTRGWTLPELLGPAHVVFYSEEWVRLGDKHDLSEVVADITGIDMDVLQGSRSIEDVSIARRMSWAAERETRLPEDRAYSLLGLFGVNMTILYGEGEKAFIRLQEEIIRVSADHSIFAWTNSDLENAPHGLLADSPRAFAQSSRCAPLLGEEVQTFEMSNRGLRISLYIVPHRADEYVAALQCADSSEPDRNLAIHLRRLGSGQYARIRCNEITSVPPAGRGNLGQIYVRQNFGPSQINTSVLSLQNGGTNMTSPATTSTLSTPVAVNGTASPAVRDNSSSQYDYPASPDDGTPGSSDWKLPETSPSSNHQDTASDGCPELAGPTCGDGAQFTTQLYQISKFRSWGGKYELLDVSFRPPKTHADDFPDFREELRHPRNIPPGLCVTFRMVTEEHRITAALLVGRADDPAPDSRITILLGSGYDGAPGFDVVDVPALAHLKSCKKPFEPMPFGTTAFARHLRVRVSAAPVVRADVRCLLLDLAVGALAKSLDRDPPPESVASAHSRRSSSRRVSAIVHRVVSRRSQGSA